MHNQKKQAFIFITGGVLSSLGKGIVASSIGALLECYGYKISMQKIDPYINTGAGRLSPYEHGEVYVCKDGQETDLDLGHYYRFTNSSVSSLSTITTGTIYKTLTSKEEAGEFGGKTIQIIPHLVNEVKNSILTCAHQSHETDVAIIELGGTVGDMESQPFLEAVRQFKAIHKSIVVHLAYVPTLSWNGEQKTKPSQHSIQYMRHAGIPPDMLLCRAEEELAPSSIKKLALSGGFQMDDIITIPTVDSIYLLPSILAQTPLMEQIGAHLDLPMEQKDIALWEDLSDKISSITELKQTLTIGILGKYVHFKDSYYSVYAAIEHATIAVGVKYKTIAIDSEQLESTDNESLSKILGQCDACIIPGGFGVRGWEGLIKAVTILRKKKIPTLGICFGMQAMVTSVLRDEHPDITSEEFKDPGKDASFSIISNEHAEHTILPPMLLGEKYITLEKGSKIGNIYGKEAAQEIHRHRYIVASAFYPVLEKLGVKISALSEEGICEAIEFTDHAWMIGVQYHPELLSKPLAPHPIFNSLILSCKHDQKHHSKQSK